MITLITGTPGAGKTAWTVQELTRLPSQRKVYIHGVPDLKLAHERIFCRSDLCDLCNAEPIESAVDDRLYVEDWPQWATDGSLIVIDEVQRIWRPTNSGSKLPDDISRLETHRHRGLDFWLISQGPHLFHSNIRLLVGRHIHLVSKWNGRSEYEWPECRQNVTSRSDAVTRPYTLPKKIFGLYKSSSLHIKQTHRKPLAFYAFFAIIPILLTLITIGVYRVKARMEPGQVTTSTGEQGAQATTAPGGVVTANDNLEPVQQLNKFPDFKPVLDNVPESAPAYEGLIKVTTAPILAGCIKTKDSCKCYTHQATPYPATNEYCLSTVKGERFNPYLRLSDSNQNQQIIPVRKAIE